MEHEPERWWRKRRQFIRQAFAKGLQPHAWALGMASLLTGLTILGLVGWLWDRKRLGAELAICWFILVLLEGAFRIHRQARERLAEMEAAPFPHLRFVSTEVEPARIVSMVVPFGAAGPSPAAEGTEPGDGYANFARVQIANDPPSGVRGQRAERVAATITFTAPDGTVLLEGMLGRWAETLSRLETGRMGLSLDESQLDLEANGVPHPLDIAMHCPGDRGCYAYNFENSRAVDLRLPTHLLDGSEIHVTVVLRSANADEVQGEFLLRNGGPAGSLALEMASMPD